jgi:hypothetical protein
MSDPIKIDKLNGQFMMRIPDITEELLKKLSPLQKKMLNDDILITIAEHLHKSNFDPSIYLSTGNSTDTMSNFVFRNKLRSQDE